MADQYFRFVRGTIIVRPGDGPHPWLFTWLPDDQADPAYPGFTVTPTDMPFPTVNGVGGVLEWAAHQPWMMPAADKMSGPETTVDPVPPELRLDIPADAYADLSAKLQLDFGWSLAFAQEPDESFTWATISKDGEKLEGGVADSWDDARLAVIEHLYPPSAESGTSA